MEKAKVFVRIVCWVGAIGDFLMFVEMVVVRCFGRSITLPYRDMNEEQMYFVGSAASLMIAWAALLVWAQCKPFERKEVLLFTGILILVGNLLNLPYLLAPVQIASQLMMVAAFVAYWLAARATSERSAS